MDSINLFDGLDGRSDGNLIGASRTWYGNGKPRVITCLNETGAGVGLQMRRVKNAAHPNPQWHAVGGVAFASKQRVNWFISGWEYRAWLHVQPAAGNVDLQLQSGDQITNNLDKDVLLQTLTGNLVGLTFREDTDYTQVGDLEALKRATGFWFLCWDPDPEIAAIFGGTWERYGQDYRKLHIGDTHVLLTTAIADYESGNTGAGTGGGGDTGGGGGGGTTTGIGGSVIGSPVPDRTGFTRVLDSVQNMTVDIYSGSQSELIFGTPNNTAGITHYEVVIDGIVEAHLPLGTHSYVRNGQTPGQTYTWAVTPINANGELGPTTTYDATMTTTGTGGGGDTGGATDGTATTLAAIAYDAGAYTYQDSNGGNPAQIWTKATAVAGYTGSGYAQVNGVDAAAGAGAIAYINNIAPLAIPANRQLWIRARATTSGDQIAAASVQAVPPTPITITDTDEWGWYRCPEDFLPYDQQCQLHAISGEVIIDKILLADINETAVPTGERGLSTA